MCLVAIDMRMASSLSLSLSLSWPLYLFSFSFATTRTDRDDMGGVGSFNRDNRTLYIGGLIRPKNGANLEVRFDRLVGRVFDWFTDW